MILKLVCEPETKFYQFIFKAPEGAVLNGCVADLSFKGNTLNYACMCNTDG